MVNDLSIDDYINQFFRPIAQWSERIIFYHFDFGDNLQVPLVLIWLVAASIFLTVYLNFINIRYFKHAIDVLRGKYDSVEKSSDNPPEGKYGNINKDTNDGQISRFQALMTSLSGTVGLGNIGGVAVAVSAGGAGAVFWMIVMGFLAMSTKFAEVMLGIKYRHHRDPTQKQRISGGPMYYLRDAFVKRNHPYLGHFFAGLFAACCIAGAIGGGNMFQANQAYSQWLTVTGGAGHSPLDGRAWLFGLVMALLAGAVIIGGIRSIANVASRIVPIMAIIYFLCAIVIMVANYQNIPSAILSIFTHAFDPNAAAGGILGAIIVGVQRATFSNEAGVGTAAIAHSAARTHDPVSQGFVGMVGPFIDTILICSITAIVILVSQAHLSPDATGMEGVALTSRAFETGAFWFPYVLAGVVTLFAFSTLISWSYYGVKAVTYFFGENHMAENIFKILFLVCTIIGASSDLQYVIIFTDASVFAMAFPNIIALYLLSPEIKRDVKAYFKKINQDLKN